MRRLQLIGLLTIITLCLHAVEISNRAGTLIDVEILTIEATRIHIQMADGQTTWLDRARLSDQSQALIKDEEAKEQDVHKATRHRFIHRFEPLGRPH